MQTRTEKIWNRDFADKKEKLNFEKEINAQRKIVLKEIYQSMENLKKLSALSKLLGCILH